MKTFAKLFVGSFLISLFITAGAAFAATDGYFITVDSQSVVGPTLALTGTGAGGPMIGDLSSHNVTVNWGDGTESATSTVNFVEGVEGFEGIWMNSHKYTVSGTYTVTVMLYNGLPDAEGMPDRDAETSFEVVIPPSATLTVQKVVINDDAGTSVPEDFTILVNSGESQQTFPGSTNGTAVFLAPGSYTVDEESVEGYVKTLGENCSGELIDGDVRTCVITNDDVDVEESEDEEDEEQGGGSILLLLGAQDNAPINTGSGSGSNDRGNDNDDDSNRDNDGDDSDDTNTDTDSDSENDSTEEDSSVVVDDEGEVLGATACKPYLNGFVKYGANNDAQDVLKLQLFLNERMGENLATTSVYDQKTFDAVKRFQTEYSEEILAPWGIDEATGLVYLTTQRWINMMQCPGDEVLPMPELVLYSQNPNV